MNKLGLLFILFSIFGNLYGQNGSLNNTLSLNNAIEIGLKNNPEILAAQKEIDAADGRILQAGKIPNPEFGVSWNEAPSFNISKAGERDIGVSQQIEYPSKRNSRIDIALFDKNIAELQLEQAKKIVAVRVKQTYYNILLSKTILQSLNEQRNLLVDLQQLITDRFKSQASTYLDVIRMKVEIARLNNDRTEAERELRRKKNDLNLAIGRSHDTNFDVSDSLIYREMNINRDSLITQSLTMSVSLQIARMKIERQQSVVSWAGKNYFPDFEIGLAQQRRPDINGYSNNNWGVELKLSVPLWFWQEPKGLEQEASASLDIATIQQRTVERQIRIAVSSAIDAIEVLQSQIRLFDSSLLKDSKDIVSTAITQYQNNQTDILTLFDVYRTYRATTNEYTRTVANYFLAIADLEAAANEQPTE